MAIATAATASSGCASIIRRASGGHEAGTWSRTSSVRTAMPLLMLCIAEGKAGTTSCASVDRSAEELGAETATNGTNGGNGGNGGKG